MGMGRGFSEDRPLCRTLELSWDVLRGRIERQGNRTPRVGLVWLKDIEE